MDYFPYGKILRQFIKTPEKYVTTGHERDVETGLDYRGARFYDSDVARFLSLDPLAAKYPSLSDYCYVGGNPIMFVDPDGRVIVFPEGTSDAFKTRMISYLLIMAILGEPELQTIALTVLTSKTAITVSYGAKDKYGDDKPTGFFDGTINMSYDYHVLFGENGTIISNLYTEFANELSHAYDYITKAARTSENDQYFNESVIVETGAIMRKEEDGTIIHEIELLYIDEKRSNEVENMARAIFSLELRTVNSHMGFGFTLKEDAQVFSQLMNLALNGGNSYEMYEIFQNSSNAVKRCYLEARRNYFDILDLRNAPDVRKEAIPADDGE